MAKLDDLFQVMKQQGASDLFVSSGLPTTLKVHGELIPAAQEALNPEQAKELIYELLNKEQIKLLEEDLEIDCSYNLPGVGRFRTNVFLHKNGLGAVFRLIPSEIPSMDELNIPKSAQNLLNNDRGIILVTGSTGSGKSTTLASMINYLNENESGHIITIEDPLEFTHKNKKCLIRQRELNSTTKSFSNALKASLRQDPDIILVGEMRDLETISLAITAAETGHLVLGTLHTGGASKTIDRVINVFPADQQSQIRVMFSESLRGIVTQHLFKKKEGAGRVAAFEVLLNTKAVANLIRENKTFQIATIMQTGTKIGMQSFDNAVPDLVREGLIDRIEAETFLEKKISFVGAPRNEPGKAPGQQASQAPQTPPSQQASPTPQASPNPQSAPAPQASPNPQSAPAPQASPSPQASPAQTSPAAQGKPQAAPNASEAPSNPETKPEAPSAPAKGGFALESLTKKKDSA